MSSTLRCRPGDLAIIVNDLPGGESNLGRLVKIYGPIRCDETLGPTWLIVPVSRTQYAVHKKRGIVSMVVRLRHGIEHPDAWMMPIRDESELAVGASELASSRILAEVQ